MVMVCQKLSEVDFPDIFSLFTKTLSEDGFPDLFLWSTRKLSEHDFPDMFSESTLMRPRTSSHFRRHFPEDATRPGGPRPYTFARRHHAYANDPRSASSATGVAKLLAMLVLLAYKRA